MTNKGSFGNYAIFVGYVRVFDFCKAWLSAKRNSNSFVWVGEILYLCCCFVRKTNTKYGIYF